MRIAGIDFPRPILDALREDKLVVFAGAGVSMGEPAMLPDFEKLARAIAQGTGETRRDGEPVDQFLGRLQSKGVEVHALAAEKLQRNRRGEVPEPTDLHRDLLRLYAESASARIVTTNFDLLFEQAAKEVFESQPEIFRAPALPLGREFNGILHVHGNLDFPNEMVLTDKDFGRAYLTEGWAPRFLVEVFRYFTILFVGYSHKDMVMNYLARALPVAEEGHRRFVLTDEENSSRWGTLGITPIPYDRSPDHSALRDGVHGLAEYSRRGILDWQHQITEIASQPPSPDEEEMGIIEEALSDETRMRFFTDAASSPEWIDWFDKRGHLDALFGGTELDQPDRVLVKWLATKFARHHPNHLFLLIARHQMRLHTDLWLELSQTIAKDRDPPLTAEDFSRWVSLLLATASADNRTGVAFFFLGERCAECGLMDMLIEIVDVLLENRLLIRPGLLLPDSSPDIPCPPTRADLEPVTDHYSIGQLWEEGLKPNLNLVAEPLLNRAIRHLETQHRTLTAWQTATRDGSPASFRRSAIESHEQDEHPGPVDVLIDIARDCLEWLASNRIEVCARVCAQLADSEVPLLRRLAVHTLSARKDLGPNQKIEWVLARMNLHEFSAHHELFMLLREIYPAADDQGRRAAIDSVLTYRYLDDEDDDYERITAYNHFNWLWWLHCAAPDCTLAASALEDVRRQHPDFEPREHPDFTHWTSGGYGEIVNHRSPWTVDELLSKPAEQWAEDLLAFQRPDLSGLDRVGLGLTVSEAAKADLEWGLELADVLTKGQDWTTDLWLALLRAWSEVGFDDQRGHLILQRVSRAELQQAHAGALSDFLGNLVRDGDTQISHGLLEKANEVAADFWRQLDRSEEPEDLHDWMTRALNHPGGKLARFWLGSLSCWSKQETGTSKMPRTYRAALSQVMRDTTLAGRSGRSALAYHSSYLLTVDEEWTRAELLPMFGDQCNVEDYQAAWDGLLYGGFTPPLAELMKDMFLEAVTQIQGSLSGDPRQKLFVRRYVTMVALFVENPLEDWIPRLFENADLEVLRCFASEIGDRLSDMDDTQQREWWRRWLRNYWENRLKGIPRRLDDREVWIMLGWLPSFEKVFPEAVDLAVRMREVEVTEGHDGGGVIFLLNKRGLWQKFPEAVAKLVVYMGRVESRPYEWHGGSELIAELLQCNLPQNLEQDLRELAAGRGWA